MAVSRSVTRPLDRLAAAAGSVGRGRLPTPLPEDGPSEVARASAAFNAMSTEVGEARRQQAEMLAGLRHDLRTPLTVIGGFAEALRDGTAVGLDAARAATAIADETARLERMVDELGDLAATEAGSLPLRLEQLDAGALCASAAERFAPVAASLARRGEPIGTFDTLIAAHALSLGLILVTNNVREFERVSDLKIENWAT
jgi:signal transduction histidine kinase